jgi:hypothetical protein
VRLISSLLLYAITLGSVLGQEQKNRGDELDRPMTSGLSLNRVTVVEALTNVLRVAQVPGGVATVRTCAAEQRYTFMPVGPTLRDALDSIVIANPEYRWYFDQGVVNVLTSSDKPSLLDLTIANFEVDHVKSLDNILAKLLATSELKEGATRLHLRQGFAEIGLRSLERPGSNTNKEDGGLTLHMRSVTLQEILNALAREHVTAVWSYQEERCGAVNSFSINFLVW